MERKPTIKDVAKMAGVSSTAVSAVLNNRPRPRVSERTRRRILEAASELKYQPNLAARRLVSRKSNLIGLIITTMLNPIYPELSKGVEEEALVRGYNILLCSTNKDPNLESFCIEKLMQNGVDGMIISSAEHQDANIVKLVEDRFPFVLLSRTVDERLINKRIDQVVLDNFRAGYMVAEHLYNLGHHRIGHIAGALNTSTGWLRTEGFKAASAEFGLQDDAALFFECDFEPELASKATQMLLSLEPPPTAIFAQNDHMALSVRDTVLKLGMRIPEDIALVGFDNIEAASLEGVELTTIDLRKYEMGALAVKMLTDKIEGKIPPLSNQITLEPELIVRRSCGYMIARASKSGSKTSRASISEVTTRQKDTSN